MVVLIFYVFFFKLKLWADNFWQLQCTLTPSQKHYEIKIDVPLEKNITHYRWYVSDSNYFEGQNLSVAASLQNGPADGISSKCHTRSLTWTHHVWTKPFLIFFDNSIFWVPACLCTHCISSYNFHLYLLQCLYYQLKYVYKDVQW